MVEEAKEAGAAIRGAEMEKRKKHGDGCRAAGLLFVPLACHNMGGWSDTAVAEVEKITSVMANSRGENPKEVALHTFQRLGITLQRGNAAMLARRVETLDMQIDGLE